MESNLTQTSEVKSHLVGESWGGGAVLGKFCDLGRSQRLDIAILVLENG